MSLLRSLVSLSTFGMVVGSAGALLVTTSSGCKSSSNGGDDTASGGSSGQSGSAGHAGSSGGNGTAGNGSGGGGNAGASGNLDAGVDANGSADAAPFDYPDAGGSLTSNGTLPVAIDFSDPAVLTKSFKVFGDDGAATVANKTVKIAKGKKATLAYTTKPGDTATDGFEEFTASFDWKSDDVANLWFEFGGANNRADALQVALTENNGRPGPPGVTDVEGFNIGSGCDYGTNNYTGAGVPCMNPSFAHAYGFTPVEPGPVTWTLRLTVKKATTAGNLLIHFEMLDGTTLIDHQTYEFAAPPRLAGEIAFGAQSNYTDVYLSNFKIGPAAAITPVVVTNSSDSTWYNATQNAVTFHSHVWFPDGLAKAKGILVFSPPILLAPGEGGDYALFEHFKRFAILNQFALVGCDGDADAMLFKTQLDELATKTNHPELATAPVFLEQLLGALAYNFAALFPARTIGFAADKMDMAHTKAPVTADAAKVPGLLIYSPTSAQGPLAPSYALWQAARPMDALWTVVAHGGQTHAVVDSWMFFLPFAQAMIDARLNADGSLKPIDIKTGWLGDFDIYSYRVTNGVAATHWPEPIAVFPAADVTTKNWLPNENLANIYSTFHYYWPGSMKDPVTGDTLMQPRPVWFTSEIRHGSASTDNTRTVTIGINNTTIPTWTKIDFYDNATLAGTVQSGATPTFMYKNIKAGVHDFMAKVTGSDNKVYPTFPNTALFLP